MSDCCSGGCAPAKPVVDPRYRRILWIALVVNTLMFGVELAGGLAANSVALLADAVDFLGDAGNYALSLLVLGSAAVWRSRTAMFKGMTMAAYGVFVLGKAAWHIVSGPVPEPVLMGGIGFAAGGQRHGRAAAVRVPRWRRQHALGMAVHAQRCDRQCGGDAGGAGCVRHAKRLAGYRRGAGDGLPGADGSAPGHQSSAGRNADITCGNTQGGLGASRHPP